MKQYLLGIYQPDGPPPADLDLACTTPARRTVVRHQNGDTLTTDGPYLEGSAGELRLEGDRPFTARPRRVGHEP